MTPLSLVTLYHTGAYSAVKGFRLAGRSVVPEGEIGLGKKLASIEAEPSVDVVWAHWSWINRAPEWVLERRVVTVLRDPVEIAISAIVRGHDHKVPQQARQWLQLWMRRDRVDDWVDFRELDFSGYGIVVMPHENATRNHELKNLYRDRRFKQLQIRMPRHWDLLRSIGEEIAEVFDAAGLAHRIAGNPIIA